MPVLSNSKHEQFAQGVAKGLSATQAYTSAGYSAGGAAQSAGRLLSNAEVRARISELQRTLSAATISLEISSRNARVQALQDRWDRLRQVIEERAVSAEYENVPGGSTGLLCKTYVGKDAVTPVYKVDTGTLAELRNHERQAAEELGQLIDEPESFGVEVESLPAITVTFVTPEKKQLPAAPPPSDDETP